MTEATVMWFVPCFEGDLKVTLLTDQRGRLMQLDASFGFYDRNARLWVAPKGTITDGATIPRFLWSLFGEPFTGRYRRAAILHDAAYEHQYGARKECDAMLYEAMLTDGTGTIKALIIYAAVRLFGGIAWRQDAARKEQSDKEKQ